MPFTGSHPAAVLPLVRSRLCASALVVGSMSPDIVYYVPSPWHGRQTHSLVGMVGVDVLLSAVALALWHVVLVAPAYWIAPAGIRARIAPGTGVGVRSLVTPWWRAAVVWLSIEIGAATHIGWDEFTHGHRYGSRHVAWLAAQQGPLPGYKWAQYASGVVGAAAIVGWLVRWWRTTAPVHPVSRHPRPTFAMATVLVLTALAGAVAAVVPILTARSRPHFGEVGYTAATHGTRTAGAVAMVLAVGWHLRHGLARGRSRRTLAR